MKVRTSDLTSRSHQSDQLPFFNALLGRHIDFTKVVVARRDPLPVTDDHRVAVDMQFISEGNNAVISLFILCEA